MGQAVDNLKWTMAFNRARTLDEFVALGKKRGYRASWAYRAYAARLDMMENFQRDMDRVRKSWNEFGKAAGHTARRLSAPIRTVREPDGTLKVMQGDRVIAKHWDAAKGGDV